MQILACTFCIMTYSRAYYRILGAGQSRLIVYKTNCIVLVRYLLPSKEQKIHLKNQKEIPVHTACSCYQRTQLISIDTSDRGGDRRRRRSRGQRIHGSNRSSTVVLMQGLAKSNADQQSSTHCSRVLNSSRGGIYRLYRLSAGTSCPQRSLRTVVEVRYSVVDVDVYIVVEVDCGQSQYKSIANTTR
jgi:hypothetical protein